MFLQKPSSSSTSALGGNSYETSASEEIDRRSPFAQSEFVLNVTTNSRFEIPYSFLTPGPDDIIYAIPLNAQADVRVWKDPSVVQVPGVLSLNASASTTSDFLLFIRRP